MTREGRDNLPAEVSRFIGREAAIAEVVELMTAHRLVTLGGPPGVGKTRLGLRVAGELRGAFPNGVWLVELAALSEPSLLPSLVAAVLGVRVKEGRAPFELLRDRLRREQTLLVLDNCEHVSDACAALAEGLLRSCPGLHVLTTSRQPLGLNGEICWPVQPLSVPAWPPATGLTPMQGNAFGQVPVDVVLGSEAGQLFVDRARAVRRGLALSADSAAAVTRICRQLDGIPLAIELAAARVVVLSPGEISARLDDRFELLGRTGHSRLPHQRTLRESVDWSHELLSDPERILLRRLSVFRGGWTLEAAEAIEGAGCWMLGDGGDEGRTRSPITEDLSPNTLDVLGSLVEKSLVQAEERDGATRYTFLETIRQYAGERLRDADEEDALVRQHREWCVAFVERAATHLRAPEQAVWRAWLEMEHDNLRTALSRTIERGEAEPGLRLCLALWHFWIDRGYAGEGYAWLTRLLALESGSARTVLRAAGLFVAAKLAFEGAELATALALGEESLAIAREVGDPHTLHRTLTQLGHIARGRGDLLAARSYYEEALPIRRELGEPVDVAVSLACLGHVARALHEYDTARALYEESLDLAEAQGHPAEITAAQHDLRRLAHERGHDDQASAWYTRALPVAQQINHPRRVAYLLEGFAILAAREHPERALLLAGAANALRRASGSILPPSEQAVLERELAPARRILGPRRGAAAAEAGAVLSAKEAAELALAAPGLAPSLTPMTSPEQLSARAHEVVKLVARGFTNRQIAEALVISERTVEWHVANSRGKLGLGTRSQLAVWASRESLEPPNGHRRE